MKMLLTRTSEVKIRNRNNKYFNGTYILLNCCVAMSWTVTSDYIWKEIAICELIRVNSTVLSVVYPYAYKSDP